MFKLYNYPDALPRAKACALSCHGQLIPVYELDTTLFAHFAVSGSCDLELQFAGRVGAAVVRPAPLKVPVEVKGNRVVLHLAKPADLCVEIERQKPLMLYIDDAEIEQKKTIGDVVHFSAGKVHEVGTLQIKSGQTVQIDAGAIVQGIIRSADATDIRITGRGIVDGGHVLSSSGPRDKLIQFEACRDVLVEGITMIRPASWMLALADCENALVRHIRQIGEVVSSDGIDVVGCRHTHIHHCFLKNNDDCIAVKAIAGGDYGFKACDPAKDVVDVLVEHCAFWNDRAGNAMEIGFETRCQSMRDIAFRDIDVMGAHGHGGVFTIHDGDRATISNVLYEDIRIEHMFDRMIDFAVMHSRYSKDDQRGQIRNVSFKKIRAVKDIFNTLNLIGGYDADHTIEGIRFEDFQMGGQTMRNADDLQLYTRHAKDIRFE